MNTLGGALRKYLKESDKQTALARQWLELWRARFPKAKTWSPETVESHLSRTLKDDPQGIRFFFSERPRADLLLEVLGVPTDQHERMVALAAESLEPDIQLVIDLSAWQVRGDVLDALFVELRNKVLREGPLKPVALVLTEDQYERLPRSYDEPISQKHLHIHKVATSTEGQALATELADDSALVLARWQFSPPERWLAADFTNGALTLEPDTGLAEFAEHGTLAPPATIEHPLVAICEPAKVTWSVEKFTPVQRRFWIYALASEALTEAVLERNKDAKNPGQRLALAQQLGTSATSTQRERLDHELAQLAAQLSAALKLPVEQLDPSAHAERLARAALRPTQPAAWRCDDTIHLLHIDSPIAHPRIEVLRPVPAVPALTRLREHISTWTEEDLEADPTLARAVETLDPTSAERNAFLHARASLLWNNLRTARPLTARSDRWTEALRELLAADPPAAALRLHLAPQDPRQKPRSLAFQEDTALASHLTSPSELLTHPPGWPTLVATRGREVSVVSFETRKDTLQLDVKGEDSIGVSQNRNHWRVYATAETDEEAYGYNRRRSSHNLSEILPLWLPVLNAEAPDTDLWLDCFERSSALQGWAWEHGPRHEKLLRTTTKTTFELLADAKVTVASLAIGANIWENADQHLAQIWLALRAALERPNAVRIPSGVVCSLGAGLCAHLTVFERPNEPPRDPVAAFDTTVSLDQRGQSFEVSLNFTSLRTHSARVGNYETSIGVHVPARLILRTSDLSATITFLASPLLLASTPGVIGTVAATVAASIDDDDDDAAQAYAYDDD